MVKASPTPWALGECLSYYNGRKQARPYITYKEPVGEEINLEVPAVKIFFLCLSLGGSSPDCYPGAATIREI